jgi:hypothetical protein
MAYNGDNAEVLPPGQYLPVTFASHYIEDMKPEDLTEDDAENFRRRMRGIRDYYSQDKLTDEMINKFTPITIPKFYEWIRRGGEV